MTKQSSASAASSPLTQTLAALAVGVIIWLALSQSQTGQLDLAAFSSYVVALLTLLERLKSLSGINAAIQRGLAAAESIFGLLDRDVEPDEGTVGLERARGELRFDRISLRYAGAEREALSDVSMTVRPGETVALVGSSGSGKTSLVNLVPRFYEPTAGRLFIDGHDITTLTLASLRAQIALVSQDVLLFDDTIAANIAYGAMTEMPREAIERAASAAHALEFIRALPQGFDTEVGENGVRLSGGQRQRIAIARAILKDAPLLILDEATSALDSESERQVQAALDALMQGRTTIVIAHRLSTIEHADRIVVLEDGQLVEEGSHAALLSRGGVYAKLHRMQFAAAPLAA
jgi:subfamily B ATP-binding cassette protein MsbA